MPFHSQWFLTIMSPEGNANAEASFMCIKWTSLGVVVVQNTAMYLVAHASVAAPGTTSYLGSVAVLLTELIKAAVSVASAAAESGPCGLVAELRVLLFGDLCWSASFAVPAFCYSLHNNLWYVAVANLDPVTIAVTTQFKIVFAAIFARLLLGQRLSVLRCSAVVLLIIGLSQLAGATAKAALYAVPATAAATHNASVPSLLPTPHAAPHAAAAPNLLRGLLAMAGLCALSGFAGALTERLMKDPSRRSSLWVRNLQMALFSTPMAAVTVLIVDGAALHAHGPWVGFNRWLLLTIGLGAFGGLAVSFVFRFADNIIKSFAVGCSIALNCMLSSLIFGLVVDRGMALGIGLVALASAVYNVPPECVWNGLAWSGVLPTSTTHYAALPLREVELASAQTPGQVVALCSVATRSIESPARTYCVHAQKLTS